MLLNDKIENCHKGINYNSVHKNHNKPYSAVLLGIVLAIQNFNNTFLNSLMT